MARMLGAWSRPWCPHCRGPAGPDCPDRSRSKKAQRAAEKREWRTDARRWTAPRSRTVEGWNRLTCPGRPSGPTRS